MQLTEPLAAAIGKLASTCVELSQGSFQAVYQFNPDRGVIVVNVYTKGLEHRFPCKMYSIYLRKSGVLEQVIIAQKA